MARFSVALVLTVSLMACSSTQPEATSFSPTSFSPSPFPTETFSPSPVDEPEEEEVSVPPPIRTFTESDPEYKLASIDAGQPLDTTDPRIEDYAVVLDELERKCKDSRTELGDKAVVARDLLAEEGVTLSLLRVLRAVDRSIPRVAPAMPCSSIFATLVVLIGD